jgi:hypothetical protein
MTSIPVDPCEQGAGLTQSDDTHLGKSPLTPFLDRIKRLPHDTCPGGGMVDALASGASGRKAVEVRVLSWAPLNPKRDRLSIILDYGFPS